MLIAGAGAATYVLKFRPADHHHASLSTTLLTKEGVGMVAESAVSAKSGRLSLVQMLGAGTVPVFTPLSLAAASAQGQTQWSANLMAGNGWIFIYVQDGNCLAAGSRAELVMQHCDFGAAQRWRRVAGPLTQDGHDFYQYANLADGKCLSQPAATGAQDASLATCQPADPHSQMLAFWWSTQ